MVILSWHSLPLCAKTSGFVRWTFSFWEAAHANCHSSSLLDHFSGGGERQNHDLQNRTEAWRPHRPILVSVIGGVIVVTTKESIKPDLFSRGAMAVALIGLTLYAAFWIGENIRAEDHADELIK